jgi:hypothetical protein
MKNTMQKTYGNNYPTNKIKRIEIPLFTQDNTAIQSGIKYFFPENPVIDKSNIVGIEANIRTINFINGDISNQTKNIIDQVTAKFVYLTFYDQNNEEIFYNVPVRSLFTINENNILITTQTLQKRIKPFQGKIKTRNCYAYVPANVTAPGFNNIYLSLTFYYN